MVGAPEPKRIRLRTKTSESAEIAASTGLSTEAVPPRDFSLLDPSRRADDEGVSQEYASGPEPLPPGDREPNPAVFPAPRDIEDDPDPENLPM